MNNKTTWFIGGLITVTVLGAAFGLNGAGNAVAKVEAAEAAPHGMMQEGQMGSGMMNAEAMQKQCNEMMQSPQMQSMMKQMLANDPAMKKRMSDMVNSSAEDNGANKQSTQQ